MAGKTACLHALRRRIRMPLKAKQNTFPFLLAGAVVTALSQASFAQSDRSIDRIEGGGEIQIMAEPQTLDTYNAASAGPERLQTNRTSAARRTRLAHIHGHRRHHH
jgi:hypothetical protein